MYVSLVACAAVDELQAQEEMSTLPSGATVARGLSPLLFVMGVGLFFPLKQTYGSDIAVRPPGWVFGVMWPILLAYLGTAWVRATPHSALTDVSFALLLGSLVFYVVVASKGLKVVAFWAVYISLACALVAGALLENTASRALLAPLVAWLLFAGQLAQNLACNTCTDL